MEATLQTIIAGIVGRSYPIVAPEGTATPYAVWQQVGGSDQSFMDNTRAKKHGRVQIAIWGPSPAALAPLRETLELTLRARTDITCTPADAHVMTHEPATGLYGLRQDWNIWS
ncbi:DUF3168 domain-containing protein [Xenophilus sp. Marseille-Q4582]|uniref:tail completion protein gp17 n=1 Tax=Xenophilus sp. Marseille-Q4582 TaxID=2866600 RepID=UPI001CE4A057|nr:DUF3168 domain-containing protein [Xenophilus sp. Marseille-Q4582]